MSLRDSFLDRTILFSFDRSGFVRHSRQFVPADLDEPMEGRVCLVTGANKGIGFEVARGLARRGAQVHMLCRNLARAQPSASLIKEETQNPDVHLHEVDISDLGSIRRFAADFSHKHVHVLVHNAGVLPSERIITGSGLEVTVATHLVGPFLMTQLLRERLTHARVIFVSSGGMYARRLDVAAMLSHEREYNGVVAYAMTKRGQVVLSELLAADLADTGATVNAMHPGWAATDSVAQSLPRFYRVMRNRLRTPREGADTALWLAVAERVRNETGGFWFDRKQVPTHLLKRTAEDEAERAQLWAMCVAQSGISPG